MLEEAGKLALRDGDWKLVGGKKGELFDLKNDPGESTNVASKHPERVKAMRKKIREIRKAEQGMRGLNPL